MHGQTRNWQVACALLILIGLLVSACGSSHTPATPAVAVVNSQPISRLEYQQYVTYAGRFYAAAGEGGCRAPEACTALKEQVLRRLLEQRVVEQYAQAHRITLSAAEQRQVSGQLAVLSAAGTPTGKLLARHGVTRDFLRSLLGDELLVQKVERAVIPPKLDQGRSYRLRIVTIPVGAGGDKVAYGAALGLATNGGAAPVGATDRTEWEAAFRLARSAQRLLAHAQIGQYVGPYRRPAGYRDLQLLGQKWGRYGRPARQRLETAYFRQWLIHRLHAARLTCFAGSKRTSCPTANA